METPKAERVWWRPADKKGRANAKEIERRQSQVVDLKVRLSLTFREIAMTLNPPVAIGTAHADWKRAMDQLAEREYAQTSRMRTEAQHRVSQLFRVLAPLMGTGVDPEIRLKAMDRYLKAQDQLNRLAGLESPQRIEQMGSPSITLDFMPRPAAQRDDEDLEPEE